MVRAPFGKFAKGDPLLPLYAEELNAFLRAADEKPGSTIDGAFDIPNPWTPLFRNQTGGDLTDDFNIVGIDGPVFTHSDNADEFKYRWALDAVDPVSTYEQCWGIVPGPVASGEIARGIIGGVSPVQIEVTDSDHEWAKITAGDSSKLTSAMTGSANILWKEAGTGTLWGLVRWPIAYQPPTLDATATSTITAGGTGTATLTESGESITAHLTHITGGENITSGKNIRVRWNEFQDRYDVIDAECE